MTLASAVSAVIDGRNYQELPNGISRWTANAAIATGTTAGILTWTVSFNPQSDDSFQKYYSIDHIAIVSQTAAINNLGVSVDLAQSDWEDNGSRNHWVTSIVMVVGPQTAEASGAMHEPVYLGRVNPGTAGRLEMKIEEVNTTTYEMNCSGLVSDKPFLAPNFWRA